MEPAAGLLPTPPSSQLPRKEWRAVSDHAVRSAGNEEMERAKQGQSDERTIYEVQRGTEQLEVDFCSITIDDGSNDDLLQQRLHDICREKEELQQMEIELRAQAIARAVILEMQKGFDAQIKEHANTMAKLKEQLQERERCIHELEMKMEERDRNLRAIKIDNEAAWAKEDLLREQNKELATFRRELDNSEAERVQHFKQIHDLKEHVQAKESQLLELEDQHRVAQEAIIYKDEQLREAQAWVARVQEMDALHSTTNHSLQAELRDRTEQFNQLWLGCQGQFAEMERHHMQTIQQLQQELAEAREQNSIYPEESGMVHANAKDATSYAPDKGNQFSVNESSMLNGGNSGILPNGNIDKTDHVHGVPVVPSSILGVVPSSLLGMGSFVPPGQVTTLHPFVMPQQAVPHNAMPANSHILESHVGHLQSMPRVPSHQYWQNQQAVPESSQVPNQTQCQPSQNEPSLLRAGAHYDYELSAGRNAHSDYLETQISSQQVSGAVITTSGEEPQVIDTNDKYLVLPVQEQNIQEGSNDTVKLDLPEQKSEPKVKQVPKLVDISTSLDSGSHSFYPGVEDNVIDATMQLQEQDLTTELRQSQKNLESSSGVPESNPSGMILPVVPLSAGWTLNPMKPGKTPEPKLMDERSLLACIVRTIPSGAGGQIRISTTLPNRLGKMLSPLHWHDYKKQYGKLRDFVIRHPELFVIEGDFIHLRDGAQEIISATTAAAKVAAAASAPYSSSLPSVAVTPVAQTNRLKRIPTVDTKPGITSVCTEGAVVGNPADDRPSQLSAMQDEHSNGLCHKIAKSHPNVKTSSESNDIQKLNGFSSEMRPGLSSVHMTAANGSNPGMATVQNKGPSNGRHGINSSGRQQARAAGAGLTTRR